MVPKKVHFGKLLSHLPEEFGKLQCLGFDSDVVQRWGRQQVCGMQDAELAAEPAGRCLAPELQFLLSSTRGRLGFPCLASSL